MVKMPRFETSCLETGIKTLVTETGQQLPPSIVRFQGVQGLLYVSKSKISPANKSGLKKFLYLILCTDANLRACK